MKAAPDEPLIVADEASKTAYVAIPKCGMTSCLEALEAFQRLAPEPVHHREWPKVITRQECADLPDDWFRWAVMRNPRERLVSLWNDKIKFRGEAYRHFLDRGSPMLTPLYGMDFPEFANRACKFVIVSGPELDRHLMPQSWFVTLDGKLIVDRLVPLQGLQDYWPRLRGRFGIGPIGCSNAISHRNVGSYWRGITERKFLAAYGPDMRLWAQCRRWIER